MSRLAILCLVGMITACSSGSGEGPEPAGDLPDAAGTVDVKADLLVGEIAAEIAQELPAGDQGACVPQQCEELGKKCGQWDDGCGAEVVCGECTAGLFCHADGSCNAEPECTTGPWSVSLQFADQSSAGTAVVGQQIPVLFEYTVSNTPECPTCRRQIVVGVEDEPQACADAGVVAVCPDSSTGLASGYLQAPAVAGNYDVYAYASTVQTCGQGANEYKEADTRVAIGTLSVSAGCQPEFCEDAGQECGFWDTGCSEVFCGDCPTGQYCTAQGSCELAGPCSEDLFQLADVYVGNFAGSVTVASGDSVPVLFGWMLGTSEELSGAERQVVVGVESQVAFCIDVPAPKDCPLEAVGLGNGELTAPPMAGTYTVYVAATAQEGCWDVDDSVFSQAQRQAIGKLEVVGGCEAESCASLDADCGYWDNGCNAVMNCGSCAGDAFCNDQALCDGSPQCSQGVFDVVQFVAGASGSGATATPGENIPVMLNYKVSNPTSCPHCMRQVVLGFSQEALLCFEEDMAGACPVITSGWGGGFIAAPETLGAKLLYAGAYQEDNCAAAEDKFQLNNDLKAVGMVTVVGSCVPSTCDALGKQCGDWGDGCGGTLHCGLCGDGELCSSAGMCKGECTEGLFEVTSVSINSSGDAASSAGGQTVPVKVNWKMGNSPDCPDCNRQLVVGVGNGAGFCAELGPMPACPAYDTGVKTGSLPVPVASGDYAVYALATAKGSCTEALNSYPSSFDKVSIGTIHVPSGCTPNSCNDLGKECGYWDDDCNYTIHCGDCPAGTLCEFDGSCYCAADDDWEPNNSAAQAHNLGTYSDHDGESTMHITGGMKNEADWFTMGALDEAWAYMEPYVHVEFGLDMPFEVTVVYVCLDGSMPDPHLIGDTLCTWSGGIDFSDVDGVGSTVYGYRCNSSGEPVTLQFGPKCAVLDDSGTLWVGVEASGQCSNYTLDLNL